jgi:hypothetical protein
MGTGVTLAVRPPGKSGGWRLETGGWKREPTQNEPQLHNPEKIGSKLEVGIRRRARRPGGETKLRVSMSN